MTGSSFHYDNQNAKELQIFESLTKAKGRKTTLDYVRMLYISYGSVCELETQILLAGDLDLIEKDESGPLKKDIAEIERMSKALIKSLEYKPLNPCRRSRRVLRGPLESLAPLLQLNWRRILIFNRSPIGALDVFLRWLRNK
ncbi:MAG: four helix bundle protein [Deltaproteobacteria bacterium]|nr:four helix bundle protein [Deltaproteobacteria bacterium]